MSENKIFSFRNSTRSFVIPGLLIPGFTAIALKGLQMVLAIKFARDVSWIVLSYISLAGMVITPAIFMILIKSTRITSPCVTFFNIIEYTFIQGVLAMTFLGWQYLELNISTEWTNMIIMVLAGWMAIPLLIALSYLFDRMKKDKLDA